MDMCIQENTKIVTFDTKNKQTADRNTKNTLLTGKTKQLIGVKLVLNDRTREAYA